MSSNIHSTEYAIQIHQVEKKYHLYKKPSDRIWQFFSKHPDAYCEQYRALLPIDLKLHKGEVLGIVGENGAGKSTLLQLICGTLMPSGGTIQTNGRIAALLELGSGFNPEFTGRENVFLNASILGLSRQEIELKYEDIVAFSGIEAFIDHPVKTYSSGMLVRLAFSVATSVNPEILVIDEALSVGDGAFARKSFERIMELKRQGTTILFCTHNLYQVEAICTQAIWLNKGQCMGQGSPSQIVKRYEAHLHGIEHSTGFQAESSESSTVSLSATPKFQSVSITLDEAPCSLIEIPTGTSGETDLMIEAQWDCPAELPAPSFAITIHAADSRMVASAGSHIDHEVIHCKDGRGQVKLALIQPSTKTVQGQEHTA